MVNGVFLMAMEIQHQVVSFSDHRGVTMKISCMGIGNGLGYGIGNQIGIRVGLDMLINNYGTRRGRQAGRTSTSIHFRSRDVCLQSNQLANNGIGPK